MGGIELQDDFLVVDRTPNDLDRLAIDFSELCSDLDIDHVFVASYVVILAGRARATQDIDVLLERCDRETIDQLVARLTDADFWGPAMPLEDAFGMLAADDTVWVAREDEMAPHLDVQFVSDDIDQASLAHAMTARIGDSTLPIGPLELQIAYKLYLGTQTDFEDAVHLYTLFEESLSTDALEEWVTKLDVHEPYERLQQT